MADRSFETVFQQHLDELRAFIVKRVYDKGMVDDVLQESMCKATSSIKSLKDDERLLPWLYTIIRNTIININRQKKYNHARIKKMARTLDEAGIETKENLCRCYEALLPSLHSNYEYLIREVDLKEIDREEVADKLDISLDNLNVRLHRARKQLRDKLLSTCRQCAENGCFDCDCDEQFGE